jgi:hypothetical protein
VRLIIIQIFKNFGQICNGVADLSKSRLGVPPKKRAYFGMHSLQEGIMPGKGKNRKLTKYLVCNRWVLTSGILQVLVENCKVSKRKYFD